MRSLVLTTFLSLDGVAEEPGDWMFDGGVELFAFIGDLIATQDLILMGRGTYDYWVDHWPTSDLEPFAPFINGTPKHVVTSSPLTGAWADSIVVSEPVVDHVAALKAGEGGDIGVHASIQLARTLLEADLVDELRLVVASTIAGKGDRLFVDGGPLARRFDLVGSQATDGGTLLLHYRRQA